MRCVRKCFPRNKGSEGNFTCKFVIFRIKIFLTLVRFRVGEGRGGAIMQKSEKFYEKGANAVVATFFNFLNL